MQLAGHEHALFMPVCVHPGAEPGWQCALLAAAIDYSPVGRLCASVFQLQLQMTMRRRQTERVRGDSIIYLTSYELACQLEARTGTYEHPWREHSMHL